MLASELVLDEQSPPADQMTEEEAVPTTPFEGKAKPSLARTAPVTATPAKHDELSKPANAVPPIVLPQVTDLLPRPRPPLTPAQELGLEGKERAKAEKCLANAIYFEARNEPVRGQIAVAQVVLNRVFSPYYPTRRLPRPRLRRTSHFSGRM
jgi:spore germination cell wall hydrolase CwlJ-like protein